MLYLPSPPALTLGNHVRNNKKNLITFFQLHLSIDVMFLSGDSGGFKVCSIIKFLFWDDSDKRTLNNIGNAEVASIIPVSAIFI